jgi:hypothetical protein
LNYTRHNVWNLYCDAGVFFKFSIFLIIIPWNISQVISYIVERGCTVVPLYIFPCCLAAIRFPQTIKSLMVFCLLQSKRKRKKKKTVNYMRNACEHRLRHFCYGRSSTSLPWKKVVQNILNVATAARSRLSYEHSSANVPVLFRLKGITGSVVDDWIINANKTKIRWRFIYSSWDRLQNFFLQMSEDFLLFAYKYHKIRKWNTMKNKWI